MFVMNIIRKYFYYKNRMKFGNIGKKSILPLVRMRHYSYPENIFISDKVSIGTEAWMYATPKSKIIIKDGTIIAPRCKIYTRNHNYDSEDLKAIPYDDIQWVADVIINEGCWIGESVIILPGVELGKGVIVGAGSVVTKSIPDYAVVAGNPAKIVKYRDKDRFDALYNEKRYIRNTEIEKVFLRKSKKESI